MNILTWTPSEYTFPDKTFVQDLVLLQEPCESIIYISAFSCCISSADSPVISITVASSMPFVSIFLAISWLFFSIPSAIPSCLAVSTEFLMSRYAILLASYSLNSCGVNLAISASSKRRSKTLSHNSLGRWVSL